MLTLFIGSSTEAKENLILPQLIRRLGDKSDVRPWYQGVDQGRFTLKPSQNVLFKADTSVRPVSESGILRMVSGTR